MLADPITRLIYGNGSGAKDYIFIAWALVAFAIGLIPFTVQYLYLRAYYAMDNTRTPFLLQIWISVANAVLAVAFALPWNDPGTLAARLALSYSLSYFLGAFLTHRSLRKRLPELPTGDTLQHLGRLLHRVRPRRRPRLGDHVVVRAATRTSCCAPSGSRWPASSPCSCSSSRPSGWASRRPPPCSRCCAGRGPATADAVEAILDESDQEG